LGLRGSGRRRHPRAEPTYKEANVRSHRQMERRPVCSRGGNRRPEACAPCFPMELERAGQQKLEEKARLQPCRETKPGPRARWADGARTLQSAEAVCRQLEWGCSCRFRFLLLADFRDKPRVGHS